MSQPNVLVRDKTELSQRDHSSENVVRESRSLDPIKTTIFFTVFFGFFYGTTSRVHISQPIKLEHSSFDLWVPMVQSTVLIYMTQALLLPVSIFFSKDNEQRVRGFVAMLIAVVTSCTVFLFFPTQIPRDLDLVNSSLVAPVWQLLYLVDLDVNCFPSLHVSLAIVSAWSFKKNPLWQFIAISVWAGLIILATLTTKQHLVVDLAGGAVVAMLSISVAKRVTRLPGILRFLEVTNS